MPVTMLYLGADRSPEQWGVTLVQNAVRGLSAAEMSSSPMMPVEGPHFVYDHGPELFLGRRGRGPLLLSWDTNLLIDYFDNGASLWLETGLPPNTTEYGLELEALQVVIALWVVRDIRISVLPATLSDARARLVEQRRSERARAFAEFASAISLIAGDHELPSDPPLLLPLSALESALAKVPTGFDRRLVEQAVGSGAHVFLTRDKRVLAAAGAFRTFGLVIATPQQLLELLAASGALFCLLDPQGHFHWPFPDLQRVTHLARAIPGLDVDGTQTAIVTVE